MPLPWPLLAVLSGLLLGFSQPIVIESVTGKQPLDGSGLSGLLALFALVPALVAVDASPRNGPKRAYAVGFLAFFVAFVVIIQWIVTTIHVYGGLPLLLALPTLALMTGAMAAYVAAAFAVARIVSRFFSWPMWAVFPPALAGVELLRNVGPVGGFPWGSLGHSFATVPVLLQLASVVGVTGLTFFAAVVNAGLAAVVVGFVQKKPLDKRPLIAVAAALALWLGFGAVRLQDDPLAGDKVTVALLQPNVNEGLADLQHEDRGDLLQRFHRLEEEALSRGADVVLWPEGSFPTRGLERDMKDLTRIKLVPEGVEAPQASVVGAVALGKVKDAETKKSTWVRHNAAFVADKDLKVKGRFDKTHLVPFGEYVPWPFGAVVRQFIPLGTTTPGNSLQPMKVTVDGHELNIGVTICYEGVFPEVSRAIVNNGATFMANLTDDRWYGVSGMATQHLLMYALRAVETGRPVARATNTGISAWIDVHGGVHAKSAMYEEALVVDDVPIKTIDTIYLKLGDWLAFLSLLFILTTWLMAVVGGHTVLQRPKKTATLALTAIGTLSIVAGLGVWLKTDGLNESLSTQAMLLTVGGLVVSFGALSHRVWGRRAVFVVGFCCVFFGLVATVVSGADKLLVVLAGAVLIALARQHDVQRQPPPPPSEAG